MNLWEYYPRLKFSRPLITSFVHRVSPGRVRVKVGFSDNYASVEIVLRFLYSIERLEIFMLSAKSR